MNSENLINWGELSRRLAGSRETVRKNRIPKKHQPIVSELLTAIDGVLSQLPERAEKGKKKTEIPDT